MQRQALTSIVALMLAASAHAAPAWVVDYDNKVQWYQTTDAGTIIVATKRSVTCVDPSTGQRAWDRTDLKKVLDIGYTPIPGLPLAMVLEAEYKFGQVPRGTLHMVDYGTGKDLWTAEGGPVMYSLPVFSDGGLLYLTMENNGSWIGYDMHYVDLINGQERWTQKNYFAAKTPLLQQWPANPKKKISTKMTLTGNQPLRLVDDGKAYLELWHHKQGIVKRDAATGEIIWNHAVKFAAKMVPAPRAGKPPMVIDGDHVYFTDGGQKIYGFKISDGSALWDPEKPPKMIDLVTTIQARDGTLYVMGVGKKHFLTALDGKTGLAHWRKPVKVKGFISGMVPLGDGRAVLTDTLEGKTKAYLLDASTGEAIWGPVNVKGGVTQLQVTDSRVFLTGDNGGKSYIDELMLDSGESAWGGTYRAKGVIPSLLIEDERVVFVDSKNYVGAINRADGNEIYYTKLPLEGGGKESLQTLIQRENGLVITWSDQNLLGLRPEDGSIAYHTFNKPPPPTGLQIVAGITAAVAAAAATAAMAAESFQAGASSVNNGAYSSKTQYHEDNADAYGAMAASLGNAAADVMRRARASEATDNYYFMLTKVETETEKGVGLVRLSLDDGKEHGRVVIDERDPDYEMDEISGWLYLLRNDKSLEGHSFGGGALALTP